MRNFSKKAPPNTAAAAAERSGALISNMEPVKQYRNKRHHYTIDLPESWFSGVRENAGGDTAVLYSADGNLLRAFVSDSTRAEELYAGLVKAPFRAEIETESGLPGTLFVGRAKNDAGRVVAFFAAKAGEKRILLAGDLSIGFALENKDQLMNAVKSLGAEDGAAAPEKPGEADEEKG